MSNPFSLLIHVSKDFHFLLNAAICLPQVFIYGILIIQYKVFLNFEFEIFLLLMNYLKCIFIFPSSWGFFSYLFDFLLNSIGSENIVRIILIMKFIKVCFMFKFMTNFDKWIKRARSRIRLSGFTVNLCCFQNL